MPWTDRIQTAAYTSPSGTRFEFQYENVSMESDKKTGTFVFPEVDGQYIQDLGRSGRRFPFTIFFSGSDYDINSDSFFQALEEIGIGTLEHPLYGIRKVIPTGTIKRRDDLVTGANQAAFSVTFSETIVDINFPSSQVNDESDIRNNVDVLNETISDQYEDSLREVSEAESVSLQNDLTDKKNFFTNTLESLTSLNEDIKNAMDTINNSLNDSILDILLDPGGLASQLLTLINTPSNIITTFDAYLEGYGSVIDTYLGSTVDSINNYHNAFLFLSGSMGAVALSMLNAEFTNRPQAIEALEQIEDFNDNITTWIDDNITDLDIPDTGEIYSGMNDIFSKISGYLVRLSFELPKKIYLTLQEDRQLIELVAELYGDLEKIDFFIQTNDLTTDEIELLPLGKEVIYFE